MKNKQQFNFFDELIQLLNKYKVCLKPRGYFNQDKSIGINIEFEFNKDETSWINLDDEINWSTENKFQEMDNEENNIISILKKN